MKIRFQQSGGFAGLTRGSELDTEALEGPEKQKLSKLLSDSKILERHPATGPSASRADGYTYEIAVTDAGQNPERRVVLTDSDLTNDVAPLVQFLKSRAKPMRPA